VSSSIAERFTVQVVEVMDKGYVMNRKKQGPERKDRSIAAMREPVKFVKRVVIAIIGLTVLALGVVMIVTPGPALVLIPVGLAILGLEFAWARLMLRRLRERISARNSTVKGEQAEHHRRRHMQ